MSNLTDEELNLLIETLTFGMPAVENGSAPEELKRWKVDRMKALLRKLKAAKKDREKAS